MQQEVLGVIDDGEREFMVSIPSKLVFIGLVMMLLSRMAYMMSAKARLVF